MSPRIRCRRIKELRFRKSNGDVIPLAVPASLNQALLAEAVREDYLVLPVATGRLVAESEVAPLRLRGSTVGFLIPGQSILSPDLGLNSDRLYGTYSLIAAMEVCQRSHHGDYTLASPEAANAETTSPLFHEGIFYLVAWLKSLGASAESFFDRYFVSLARSGIVSFVPGSRPLRTERTLDSYAQPISLSKNPDWPEYVRTIVSLLEPHATDPFLRFFYLYQIVETLMGAKYKSGLGPLFLEFKERPDLSVTQLRDYIEKFQKIYKEKPRINAALQPTCPNSQGLAEALLEALGEETEDVPFGELIYKVRNIIFHDYSRVHAYSSMVSDLEDALASYLFERHLS